MNYPNRYHIKNEDGSKGKLIDKDDVMNISEGDKSAIKKIYKK